MIFEDVRGLDAAGTELIRAVKETMIVEAVTQLDLPGFTVVQEGHGVFFHKIQQPDVRECRLP